MFPVPWLIHDSAGPEIMQLIGTPIADCKTLRQETKQEIGDHAQSVCDRVDRRSGKAIRDHTPARAQGGMGPANGGGKKKRSPSVSRGGRHWTRTSDLHDVNVAL
jgi:hypothetical protein